MISLIFKLFRMPLPVVVGLMVVRSDMFQSSVRFAWRNRGLVTRSGRLAALSDAQTPDEPADPTVELVS